MLTDGTQSFFIKLSYVNYAFMWHDSPLNLEKFCVLFYNLFFPKASIATN